MSKRFQQFILLERARLEDLVTRLRSDPALTVRMRKLRHAVANEFSALALEVES